VFAWATTGDEHAPTVVYLHGTPGSRDDVPYRDVVTDIGARLLTFDRPGYGASPALPDASLLDVARRALADIDALGVGRFAVLGWSGGGPHALACAAFAPERVTAVGLLASWAPMRPPDPGLPRGVRFAMRVAATAPRGVVRAMFVASGRRSEGMVDDVRRVARPWGFDVDAVAARTPVRAWHAAGDREVPIGPWQGRPGIALTIVSGGDHEVDRATWRAALRALVTPS
jgi:pimeloyl-ACP methyl ester carboxylesterase